MTVSRIYVRCSYYDKIRDDMLENELIDVKTLLTLARYYRISQVM